MKRIRSVIVVACLAATLIPVGIVGADDVRQLPNLVTMPPYDVQFGPLDDPSEYPWEYKALRFSVLSANMGAYALELRGALTDRQTSEGRVRDASQCIWWVSRVCTQTQEIGDFVWHAEHGHWHLADYATYELRLLTSSGEPDMSPDGLVAPGQKVSFCLMDSYTVGEPPGHDPLRRATLYQSCTAYLQGISPGWGDEYGYWLHGQQIPVSPDQVPDGWYAVVVTVNPSQHLLESDLSDNTAFRRIHISNQATVVTWAH